MCVQQFSGDGAVAGAAFGGPPAPVAWTGAWPAAGALSGAGGAPGFFPGGGGGGAAGGAALRGGSVLEPVSGLDGGAGSASGGYEALAAAALARAAEVASHRERAGTTRRRHRALMELAEWCLTVPRRPEPEDCTPEEILVYLEGAWHVRHKGLYRHPATGEALASPGYLVGAVSALRTGLRRMGVADDDNPTNAQMVLDYVEGYERKLFELGYRVSGAVPASLPELLAVLEYLDRRAGTPGTTALSVALYRRDAAAFLYLWYSAARGYEAGKLRTQDLLLCDTVLTPAWPLVVSGGLSVADQVLAEPGFGTKGHYESQDGILTLPATVADSRLCLMRRFRQLSDAMEACGSPILDYIFCTMSTGRGAFLTPGGVTGGALNERLKTYLTELGLNLGHSLHGVKRGRLQFDRVESGMLLADVAAGRHADVATTVKYLHPTRHRPRLERYQAAHPLRLVTTAPPPLGVPESSPPAEALPR